MLKNLILITCLCLSVFLVSCDGDKGDVGPAGPAGPGGAAGAQGPKGDSGVNGQDGEDGVGARMISTGPVKSYQGGYVMGKSNVTAEDSIYIANSVIVMYVKSQNRWWAMPGIARWDDDKWTEFGFYSRYAASRLYITLQAQRWSEDQPTAPERDFQDIRAVLIPANKFRGNAEVNLSSYEETIKSLGLKDSDAVPAQ
jgi:hypothetical protein